MTKEHRTQRRRTPIVEGLESREVLATRAGGLALAATREVVASAIFPLIRGQIVGTVTEITPLSARSERVSYTARAKVNVFGDGKGPGRHTIASRPLANGATVDTYRNGLATVTGTTDTVAIRYTGTGRTRPDGSFVATLRGTARSIAGSAAGLSGAFTARLEGDSRTGPFTVSLTIRP